MLQHTSLLVMAPEFQHIAIQQAILLRTLVIEIVRRVKAKHNMAEYIKAEHTEAEHTKVEHTKAEQIEVTQDSELALRLCNEDLLAQQWHTKSVKEQIQFFLEHSGLELQ